MFTLARVSTHISEPAGSRTSNSLLAEARSILAKRKCLCGQCGALADAAEHSGPTKILFGRANCSLARTGPFGRLPGLFWPGNMQFWLRGPNGPLKARAGAHDTRWHVSRLTHLHPNKHAGQHARCNVSSDRFGP